MEWNKFEIFCAQKFNENEASVDTLLYLLIKWFFLKYILDLLSFDLMETRDADKEGDNKVEDIMNDHKNYSECQCTGPKCVCCTDFNITFIDLGKSCVKIHYISQKEGVKLNLTYGDSSLKTHTVNSKYIKENSKSIVLT